MFQNENLKTYLEEASSVKSQATVLGEWNMNYAENIDKIGNYKNRPTVSAASGSYVSEDSSTVTPTWYGYTDSSVISYGGIKDIDSTPYTFVNKNEKEELLYSLVDCVGKFRPRSGINKLRFFDGYYTHNSNSSMAKRPRFYISSKNDKFKYWTSCRIDTDGTMRGIGKTLKTDTEYYIDDAAPFVKYVNNVPANRIVVKMQTMVGEAYNGPYSDKYGIVGYDPLYEDPAITNITNLVNQRSPLSWKIQYLDSSNNWQTAKEFTDSTRVIGADGYVELAYGLHINGTPVVQDATYKDIFTYFGEIASSSLLPFSATNGDAYLVPANGSAGTLYIWNGSWLSFTPSYNWFLNTETLVTNTPRVTDMTVPSSYVISATTYYREFQYIKGIRVVVDTVNNKNTSFDLIEMSPRLVVDLTDKTMDYGVKKVASDIGNTGIPVGQLLASTGTLNLFDYDEAFNYQNTDSIIYNTISQNIQIRFYESIIDVNGVDYHVPLKTMYVEGFPQINSEDRKISLILRDLYFYFETTMAPQLLLKNVSLSAAVSILLDSIGFTNYYFKRVEEETEDVIPYFFIAPDTNVAQALNDLADSTQTAMFFDEYNNLVCMSKDYMMPKIGERTNDVDITLYGSNDSVQDGIFKNKETTSTLSNIIGISSESNMVYNGGKISYTTRYIQKSYGTLREAALINRDQVWKYKPVLLWEVSGTESLRSVNDEVTNQSSYSLSAITLNSDLIGSPPTVNSSNVIINNVMDFGPSVYWISRYQGYFYANGEIIKYDAVEYNVSGIGNVWVSSVQDYQYYFSKLPFGGKIFPTGNVRIYCEPSYEADGITPTIGAVLKHGRGQFGTKIVKHTAGFADDSHWTDSDNIYNCQMEEQYIFSTPYQKTEYKVYPSTTYTTGATTIVLAANTTGLQAGYFIDGTNITPGTKIKTISHASKTIELSAAITGSIGTSTTLTVSTANLKGVEPGSAGVLSDTFNANAKGIIKDFLNESYYTETSYAKNVKETSNSGSIQASALVLTGYQGFTDPLSSISYVATDNLDTAVSNQKITYDHFGTRMRIIGKIENADISSNSTTQLPLGAMYVSSTNPTEPDQSKYIAGAGGGLAFRIDTTTDVNNGYYFEISALSQNSVNTNSTVATTPVQNVFFYKLQKEKTSSKAIPVLLWSGQAPITVDDGDFVGMSRLSAEKNPTVYDLAVEQEIISKTNHKFYLYINNVLMGTATDTAPIQMNDKNNKMALFVRGTSKVMFEHIYALANNPEYTSAQKKKDTPLRTIFSDETSYNPSFSKYTINPAVHQTYLSAISPSNTPKYLMYYDEFGTIMRECAYFNIRYDKAYPAIYSKISPTFNNLQGYAISGFLPNAYGAEFMVFNITDSALNLDETSGNYLRIQGLSFTQQSPHDLTVDEYFSKNSDYSNPKLNSTGVVNAPSVYDKQFIDIQNSRNTYGKKDFTLNGVYIQNVDAANKLMEWMVNKVMKQRKSVGVSIFANPMIQLGDIVKIDYVDNDGYRQVADEDARFIVYNIEYNRAKEGPTMNLYLSEVV